MQYRLVVAIVAMIAAGCTSKKEAADTTNALGDTSAESQESPPPPPANVTATTTGPVDQMPATATFTVTGPKNFSQWNGSWSLKGNRLGCGVNVYPKVVTFDMADEDNTMGDFEELNITTNDGPDVGGSTQNVQISLNLDRGGPGLSINTDVKGDTGTLTVVSNSGGNAKLTVKAKNHDGVSLDGEFTCVPRPSQ